MTSPFMKALESRLANPSFQRGITEMGMSILANNAPSTQPKAGFGATLAQGALRGMDAARQETEYQKAQQQQAAMAEAAQEASQGIEDPALRRLASVDPDMARAVLMKRYEREITPYQQAQLDQGGRRLDITEDQAAADRALAERNFGLKEQGLDLQRQRLAQAGQPKEPAIVSTLRAAGIDPTSPEGQTIIRDNLTGAAEGQNATQFGSVPAGMARVADPNAEAGFRLVPLQGSEAQIKQEQADQRALLGREQQMQDLDTMMRDLNRVMDISQAGGGGPIGGSAADIPIVGPATAAGQLRQHLEPVRTNVAFDRLQSMRDSSPTGGALGSITERELSGLAASSGALNEFLPEGDLQRNVLDLGVKYINAAHGTDAQIDAAVNTGRLTKEQAAEGKALRDQQIAEWQEKGQGQTQAQPAAQSQPAVSQQQIVDIEARGEALERQYIANGMSPEEAEQLVASELRKEFGL